MKNFLILILTLFVFLVPVYAQDVSISRPDDTPPILPQYSSEVIQPETDTSIPIPVEYLSEVTREDGYFSAGRSFIDSIVWDRKNVFGVSLGANEGFVNNVYPSSGDKQSSVITSFSGSAFTNVAKGKSRLHIDYSTGYQLYHQQGDINGGEHNVNFTYTYQLSPRSKFNVSDHFSSSENDPLRVLNLSLNWTPNWTPIPSYEILLIPQRETRNMVNAQFSTDLTESTHIGFFAGYDNYWYEKQDVGHISSVQVGANLDQRITNWFFLTSSYSTYLNNVDERYRDHQIHRLEIGRFRFMLAENVEVFASGGIEIANSDNTFRTQEMLRAGLSWTVDKTLLYANYQRTMMSALGQRRILPSDVVSIGLGHRLSDKANLRLSGSYIRSVDFDYAGELNGYSGSVQFEYALTSHLFASAGYSYQYQKNSIWVITDIPQFNRSMVSFGLQYVWSKSVN